MTFGRSIAVAALTALAAAGCSTASGSYTWVDSYTQPPRATDRDYVLAPGDLISIRVYNQESMGGRMRVRGDGKITLPFVNDVQAAGLTTTALARQVEKRLKDFVVSPVVTVVLEEARPVEVYVLGEVARPGRYAIEQDGSVLQALAAAGGLTPFAAHDRVFVVRTDPAPVRVRFRYGALTRLEGSAAKFALRAGDTVVVE